MEVVGWHRWLVGMWAAMEVLLLGGLVYGWPSLVFLLKQRRVYSDLCPPEHTPQPPHSNHTLPQSGGNATNAGAGPFGNGSSLPVLESSSFPANYPSLSGAWLALTTSLPLGYSYRSDYGGSESSVTGLTSAVVNVVENATLFAGGKGDNSSGFADDWEGENCAEQDAAFALAYTVVTAVQSLGSIGVGHAQRTFGMRTTRIGSGLTYIAGLLMVGFITPGRPALLITGVTCVAMAGLALLVTNVQLGVMFGRGQTTFVGVLSGCYDVSAIMQLLINTVITSGADYLYTYIGVAVLSCLTLVSTLLWLPPGPVFVAARGQFREEIILGEETEMITQSLKKEDRKSTSYVTSEKLLSSLTSPLYIFHVLWFAFLQLRLFFFVGVLNRWLSSLADGNLDDVSHFTSVQLYTGCTSVIFAVLAGCLYDFQRHRYKDWGSREWRYLGGALLPLLLGSALCCVLSVLVLFSELNVLYLTFCVLAAFRSVMYSLAVAFLAVTFPAELFGVLYGTMLVISAVVGCLQYALFIWSEHSQDAILQVNILLLCTSAVTFLHPLHILWKCRRSGTSPSQPA